MMVLDFKSLYRRLPHLLLISIASGLLAYGLTARQDIQHLVHYSYLISLSQREATGEYRFDGYYALQATELFAKTIAAWARTPEVIVAAHQAAGLPLPSDDARALQRLITTNHSAPQLVEITIKHRDAETTRRLAQGLRHVMAENIDRYHEQGIPALEWRVVATESVGSTRHLGTKVIAIATMVIVFVFSINALLLRESLR